MGLAIRMMKTTGTRTLPDIASSVATGRARRLICCLVGLFLGACAQLDTQLDRSALAIAVPPQDAIALPPPGSPSIVGVTERRYANAIQHDIALATSSSVPGQNLIKVQLFGPMGGEAGDTRLVDRALHEAELRREMRAALPDVAMQHSPLYAQNNYGPFGYAFGWAGRNDLCLYAWQRLAGTRDGAPFANLGTVQLRIRLCQSGASERGLLAIMHGYTINTSFAGPDWNPYGSPASADRRLGQTGQPIVPTREGSFATMLDPLPPTQSAPPAQTARAPAPTAQQPFASPPETVSRAPIVPPPPVEGTTGTAPVISPPIGTGPVPIVPRPPQP